MRNKHRRRLLVSLFGVITDAAAITVSFLIASFVWFGDPLLSQAFFLLAVLIPIYLVTAANYGAYGIVRLVGPGVGVTSAIMSFLFTMISIGLIIFMFRVGTDFSRAIFLLGSGGSIVLIPALRLLLQRPIMSILGGTAYTTVIIRDGVDYKGGDDETVVTPEELGFQPQTSDPFHFHAFGQTVANADRVLVACPQERYALWSSVLKGMAIDGEILTGEDDGIGIIGIGTHGAHRTMIVAAGPLDLRERFLKRVLDIVLSIAALILLAPLLIMVAIAIKLESKGPVLFVQDRIGRDNQIFRLYKFRSMQADQCDAAAATLTSRADPRVTRVGEFIRRTSIDEMPQLINVLNGEMSIVGPRPHAIAAKAADTLYWDVDPRYRHRHSMKPGLTGLAQVRGFRGSTDHAEDLVNRLTSDLEYAANWSIASDLRIIFATLRVLRHDNAF